MARLVRRFVVLAVVAAAVVIVSSVLAVGQAVAPKYRFSGWVDGQRVAERAAEASGLR